MKGIVAHPFQPTFSVGLPTPIIGAGGDSISGDTLLWDGWALGLGMIVIAVLLGLVRRQRQALRKLGATRPANADRYRMLFDNMIDGYALHEIVTDPAGKPVDYVFLEANSAFGRITGLEPARICGKRVTEVIPGIATDPVDWIGRYGEVAATGRNIRFEQHSAALGKWFSVVAFRPQPGQFATILEDISERKEAELAVNQANEELEQRVRDRTAALLRAKEEAELAHRTKSAFLATMSHEIRTPLNSVLGFTRLLLEELPGPLNTEQRKQLQLVKTSAGHLLSLINDVLDLSKIEAGSISLHPESFDLAKSLRDWIQSLAPQLLDRHLEIRLNLSAATVPMIGDVRRIGEIVLNLLSNAIKFSEGDEITVHLEQQEPSAGNADGWVSITVVDYGPGVKEEDHEQVFEPYTQLEAGQASGRRGTGLGLSISRKLAEQMGGTLTVSGNPDRNCVFTLLLPAGSDSGVAENRSGR